MLDCNGAVFVPLCGKSLDMGWLRERGAGVLGVELSPIAAEAFFEERGDEPTFHASGKFGCYEADRVRILCGDFFDLNRDDMAGVGAVYDRASMIALPPEMRERYVRHMASILQTGARVLLITLDYPQDQMDGPPFSVSPSEVEALYRDCAKISLLAQADVLSDNPRFAERGLARLLENIYLLEFKPRC